MKDDLLIQIVRSFLDNCVDVRTSEVLVKNLDFNSPWQLAAVPGLGFAETWVGSAAYLTENLIKIPKGYIPQPKEIRQWLVVFGDSLPLGCRHLVKSTPLPQEWCTWEPKTVTKCHEPDQNRESKTVTKRHEPDPNWDVCRESGGVARVNDENFLFSSILDAYINVNTGLPLKGSCRHCNGKMRLDYDSRRGLHRRCWDCAVCE